MTPAYPLKLLTGHIAHVHDDDDNWLFSIDDERLARHVVESLNRANPVIVVDEDLSDK